MFPIVHEHYKGEREVEEDGILREEKQNMEGFLSCVFPDNVPNSVRTFYEMSGSDDFRGESDPEKSQGDSQSFRTCPYTLRNIVLGYLCFTR
jgi:hypothetical protein